MKVGKLNTVVIIIIALMLIQSVGGIAVKGLYHDNTWVLSAWRGNDLVTLVVAVPILIISIVMKPSLKTKLVLLGTLYYEFYNNMYYLLGANLNKFFLVYVAIFILTACSIIWVLLTIEVNDIAVTFKNKIPKLLVRWWMVFLSITLGGIWIWKHILYILYEKVPSNVIDTGGNTDIVAIFDLSMIVSVMIVAVILMKKDIIWGYIIAAMVLVQSGLYSVVLFMIAPFQANAGIETAWKMTPLWVFLGIGCIIASGVVIKNVKYLGGEIIKHE